MIFQCFWLCDSWCVRFFSSWQKISCSSRKCASNIFLYRESQFRSVCIQVEYIPNTRGEEMMLVLQDRPVSSTCCTWKPQSPFFKSFPWHPLVPIGTNRFRSRGSTRSSMFVHDLGHSCPGRRVHLSGHPDFGMSSNFGALFSSWVRAAASAACDAKPGSHAMTSIAFADIWEADELCSFNMAYEPESIFHSITLEHNPASVLLLLQLWLRIFWEDRSPSVSTTELVLSVVPEWLPFLMFTCPRWQLSDSPIPCPPLQAHPEFSSIEAEEQKLCTKMLWLIELDPLSATWSSWSFGQVDSKRFSRGFMSLHDACMHAPAFRFCLNHSVSSSVSCVLLGRLVVFILQGMTASMGIFNFCPM